MSLCRWSLIHTLLIHFSHTNSTPSAPHPPLTCPNETHLGCRWAGPTFQPIQTVSLQSLSQANDHITPITLFEEWYVDPTLHALIPFNCSLLKYHHHNLNQFSSHFTCFIVFFVFQEVWFITWSTIYSEDSLESCIWSGLKSLCLWNRWASFLESGVCLHKRHNKRNHRKHVRKNRY